MFTVEWHYGYTLTQVEKKVVRARGYLYSNASRGGRHHCQCQGTG